MSHALLFDVDGTLADTFDTTANIINELAPQFKYPMLEDRRKLRQVDWRSLPSFLGVSRFKARRFMKTLRERLREELSDASLPGSVKSVLNIMHVSGYRLGAMSSCALSSWDSLTKEKNYFDMADLDGPNPHKARVIRDFLTRFDLTPKEVVYFGDEVEDIEIAKQLGIKSAAVGWGVNHVVTLQQYEPDFVVNKPEALLTVISQLDD